MHHFSNGVYVYYMPPDINFRLMAQQYLSAANRNFAVHHGMYPYHTQVVPHSSNNLSQPKLPETRSNNNYVSQAAVDLMQIIEVFGKSM